MMLNTEAMSLPLSVGDLPIVPGAVRDASREINLAEERAFQRSNGQRIAL